MDSKTEEISDPCQPNLANMPKVVMEEVLKNLDGSSILRLRKVSRDLRFSIDEIKPVLHLNSIRLKLPLTASSIESYLESMKESYEDFQMDIHEPKTICIVGWIQNNTQKYFLIPMEEAKNLLKNKNLILDELSIVVERVTENIKKKEDDIKKFYESMKSLLKNRSCLLKTNEIKFQVPNLSETANVMNCIDPKSLNSISIKLGYWNVREPMEMDFSELETLEQWKNAEYLQIDGDYILTPIESFASFKTISVYTDEISIEILNEVIELIVNSPELKTFIIKAHDLEGIMDQVISNCRQFGFSIHEEDVPSSNFVRTTTYSHQDTPGSTEKLQIIFNIGLEKYIEIAKV